jgi:hypothetical protein
MMTCGGVSDGFRDGDSTAAEEVFMREEGSSSNVTTVTGREGSPITCSRGWGIERWSTTSIQPARAIRKLAKAAAITLVVIIIICPVVKLIKIYDCFCCRSVAVIVQSSATGETDENFPLNLNLTYCA